MHGCGSLDVIRSCLLPWMVYSDSFRFSVVNHTADITIYYKVIIIIFFPFCSFFSPLVSTAFIIIIIIIITQINIIY